MQYLIPLMFMTKIEKKKNNETNVNMSKQNQIAR